MNTKHLIAAIVMSFFFSICFSQNQTKKEKEAATEQQIKDKIQANNFEIDVDRAYPMSGKSIYLTSSYNLIIRNDSAITYLPYYGRAYSAPYGGSGGIKFQDLMKDYSVTPKKNNKGWTVTFKMNTPDYNYEISVDIFTNGKSTLNVNSNQQQPISFDGEMVLKE